MTEPTTRERLKGSKFCTTHSVLKYRISSLLQHLSKLKTNVNGNYISTKWYFDFSLQLAIFVCVCKWNCNFRYFLWYMQGIAAQSIRGDGGWWWLSRGGGGGGPNQKFNWGNFLTWCMKRRDFDNPDLFSKLKNSFLWNWTSTKIKINMS